MKYRNPRTRFGLTIGVLRKGNRETAYLMDISEGGMKIQGLRSPVVDEVLRLHVKGSIIYGRICWVSGQFCGLQFCETQAPADLRRVMAALPRPGGRALKIQPVFKEYGALQAR